MNDNDEYSGKRKFDEISTIKKFKQKYTHSPNTIQSKIRTIHMSEFFLEGFDFGKHVQPLVVIVGGFIVRPLFVVLFVVLLFGTIPKGHDPLIAPIKIELVQQFPLLGVQFVFEPALVLGPVTQFLVLGVVGILGGI